MLKKYENHFLKVLFIALTLGIGVVGYWARDIHSKVNDGVFVRYIEFDRTIISLRVEDEHLRREICDRLRRLEANQDKILDRLQ